MSFPDRTLRVFLSLLLLLIAALALYCTRPPAALGLDAPPGDFSAARAVAHLETLAARPHPTGTEANERARDYLVKTLTGLGAAVEVEKTTGIFARGRFVRAGSVQNIVGRFPGRANSRAVMLVAHYDSVPESPGAADDGAGVISILETVRALRTGPPLQNDLVILFTDGEEPGLLGAAGYVADHPDLAAHVGLIVNLEARGSSGPAMMFETSDQNGLLIPALARAAPYPMASSLMYSIYKLLPNDTDLSELKTTGVAAYNFAFIETFQNYHSSHDTRENLDARSVQQMGANVLGLARHFGQLPLTEMKKHDAVYFNWLGSWLVVYPHWFAWIVALVTFGLLILAVVRSRGNGAIKLSLASLGVFFLLLLAVAAAMLLPEAIIKLLLRDSFLQGDTPSNRLLFAGIVAIGFAGGTALLSAFSGRFGCRNLHAGMLVIAAVLATVVCVVLPGGGYLFQWPVLFGIGSLVLALRAKSPAGNAGWGLVAAVPALLILAPLTYLFFVVLDLNASALLAASLLLTLLLAVAWPIFDFLLRPWRPVTFSLTLVGIALLIVGASLSHFSPVHPRRDTLLYSVNVDHGKAKWISYDRTTDEWTRQYLGPAPKKGTDALFTAGSDRDILSADAPLVTLEAPTATMISDRFQAGIRTLRLHLSPARHARSISVRMPGDTDLQSVTWNNRSQKVGAAGAKPWSLRYDAVPAEGVDLELQLRGQVPLHLWVSDVSPDLPQLEGRAHVPRPDKLMAGMGSDLTLVARQYTF